MLSQSIEKHEQNKDCVLKRLVTTKPLCYLPVDDSFFEYREKVHTLSVLYTRTRVNQRLLPFRFKEKSPQKCY